MAEFDNLLSFLDSSKASSTNAPAATTNAPVANAGLDVAGMTQLTRDALAKLPEALQNAAPSSLTVQGDLSWFDRNQRKDEQGRLIPIDTNEGVNLGDFARVMWQRRPEDRVSVLRQMFPNSVIRQADTGEPLIETTDQNGLKKDVLLSPPGAQGRDFLGAVEGSIGATTGGVAGMAIGSAIGSRIGPQGATAGRIIGGAIGSGIGGAIQDLTARTAEGLPLDPREIAKEQTQQVLLNSLWDVGYLGGSKLLRLASPFAKDAGPLQFNLKEGKDYLKNTHGIDFETTAAEESGSPLLARLERTESQLPGASSVLGGIYKRGSATLTDMLQAAIGGRQSTEELGRDLMDTARRQLVQPAEKAVQSARDALVAKGESELAGAISSIAPTAVSKQQAGEALRTAFNDKRDLAKKIVDDAYNDVRSLPGGSGKSIDGTFVADAANAIIKELPKTSKGVLSSGLQEGIEQTLKDMKAQKGQLMSLDELTKLKNSARDAIAKTEAVPGVKDRWFGMVSDAYDNAITQGIAAIDKSRGNTALSDALRNARDTYKTKLLPFDQEGLHDVLRTSYETGFKSPEELVNRMFSGARADHNYRVMQQTLGANSPEFQQVRSAVLNGWMEKATDQITGRINPTKFENMMESLRAGDGITGGHPAIFKDITQGNAQAFFKATAALRAAGKEITDVDPGELRVLLSSGSPTKATVQGLMDAQKARDNTLANTYLSNLATGKPNTTSPAEFVSSLFNANVDSNHLNEVLSALKPSQVDSLQKAALYRVLTKASESSVDLSKFLAGQQSPVQAMALAKAIGPVGSAERARNEMLMGPDLVNMVKATIGVLAPRELKTELFKAAGSMAATGMLEKLLSAPFQYASKYVQKSILAEIYTSAPIKAALANRVLGPKETALVANTLIASEPFINHLRETYGNDAAYSIIRDAKSSIDRFIQQDASPTQGESQHAELLKFIQGNKAKVKTQARP